MASLAVPGGRVPTARAPLFLGLILLASLNAFAGPALRILAERGLAYAAFELFGISAILWLALAAALALLREAPPRPLRRFDPWIGAATVAAALVPSASASAVALTLVGLHLFATAPAGSAERRAGLIALAMTGPLLWGRFLLALFGGPLLAADTWLVGAATGAAHAGNILAFADGSGRIGVAPGCSSWQGMSLAILMWVTVNQWFRVPFSRRAAATCAAALAATVAINVARIGAMVRFPAHLEAIHVGWGWHLAMWATLVSVTAICLWGARREAFA
ncbi:MAG: hypothetical protein ACJ8DZ_08590 [Allosphingosinicella sp.]